jgi:predicted phage tail protein
LEKNTLLVTFKIHSTFHKFFDQPYYSVEVNRYIDVLFYLKSMHPRFMQYLHNQELLNDNNEGYALLTNDLHLITNEELYILKAKEGDIIHLAPAIIGGGGKKGGLLAIFAIFAFLAIGPAAAALGGGAAGAAGAGGAAAGAVAPAGGGFFGGFFKAFNAMPSFMKSIVGNIGMSVLTKMFMKQPKQSESEAVRENGLFNGLTNSTSSGTPIPLHYGMPRVSGQFLSGYIDSVEHGKSDIVKVGDQF